MLEVRLKAFSSPSSICKLLQHSVYSLPSVSLPDSSNDILTRPTISVSFPILVPFFLAPRGSRTGERVKNAFWRERGRFFISPGIPHSLTKCVFCILAKGREGRGGEGLQNGLFLDGGEYGMVQEGIVVYIFRHRNLGWICIPLLAWQQAQIGALGITIIIIVGWMDGNAVSQTFISTPGREGGNEQTSPKGD